MDDLLSAVEGGREDEGGGDGTLCMLLCCEAGRLVEGDERRDTSRDVFLLLSFVDRLLVGLRERRPRGDLDLLRGERRGDLLECLSRLLSGDLIRRSRSLAGDLVPEEGLLSSPGDLRINADLEPRSGDRLWEGDDLLSDERGLLLLS